MSALSGFHCLRAGVSDGCMGGGERADVRRPVAVLFRHDGRGTEAFSFFLRVFLLEFPDCPGATSPLRVAFRCAVALTFFVLFFGGKKLKMFLPWMVS